MLFRSLRLIWRDLRSEDPPDVYEWQVLPFGTTCSPCCAIFALQMHARHYQDSKPVITPSVERFYVDNCLESLPNIPAAKDQVDQLCSLLAQGGFELRQWASNRTEVVAHLPTEARSVATDQWLVPNRTDPLEP